MKKSILAFIILLCLSTFGIAQSTVTTLPRASQKAMTGQTIGLSDIAITYHRPAVKDREIWGKLIPYDAIWRAGANENTIISISHEVTIEGQKLAAGKYGLHLIPGKQESTIIFSTAISSWGSFSYKPEEDALRVKVKNTKADHFYELLTFTFDEVAATSAVVALQWENLKFPFKVSVDVPEIVLASLREELRVQPGWTWLGWNEAAAYCLRNKVNMKEALSWANRSVFMNPTQTNMLTKANLTAKINGQGNEAKEKELLMSSLEKDLTTFPVTWKEWHGLALYSQQKGHNDKALDWVAKSVAMSPNMTNMISQSEMYAKLGKEKEAKKVKKEAIARGSNSELNAYGYKLLFGGNPAGAVEIFEANAQKNPEDPNVWDSLGEGYIGNGQNEKAIESLKKSISLNPIAAVRANSIRLLKQIGVEYSGKP